MDQCTHEVRLQYWKNIISQCQARPAGQTAKQWLAENGISEPTYYVWQRKVRKEIFEQEQMLSLFPMTKNPESVKQEVSFAEIPLSQNTPFSEEDLQIVRPAAVIRTETCTISLAENIPDAMLSKLLQEVFHA